MFGFFVMATPIGYPSITSFLIYFSLDDKEIWQLTSLARKSRFDRRRNLTLKIPNSSPTTDKLCIKISPLYVHFCFSKSNFNHFKSFIRELFNYSSHNQLFQQELSIAINDTSCYTRKNDGNNIKNKWVIQKKQHKEMQLKRRDTSNY